MIVGVIPARFASTRLPGKPLVDIVGKPMIERVWKAASDATTLDKLIIATDDQRIVDVATAFGADVELTDPDIPSGTDRCHAVITQRGLQPTVVINIQGDEPLLDPTVIDAMVGRIQLGDCDVTTPITAIRDASELAEPSVVKVAVTADGRALYFTRAAIATEWKHIGLYAYTWQALCLHKQKAPSKLEEAERLEQLRLLESGARFQCVITTSTFQAVDTPADVQRVINLLAD